jgi:hypothetical protein
MQERYEQLLDPNKDPHLGLPIPELETVARKLLERTRDLKLFLHSYSVSLNFEHGDFDVFDMMRVAVREQLAGIKIHVGEGKPQHDLASMEDEALTGVRDSRRRTTCAFIWRRRARASRSSMS